MKNYEEINSREKFEEIKNNFTHVLQVWSPFGGYSLYLLHTNNWDAQANEIAKENGYEKHDHDNENFIGCPMNDDDCIEMFLNDL